MRERKSLVFLLGALALQLLALSPAFSETSEMRAVFYRVLASYQHGNEVIDFDIIVGCGVRVTRWGDGSSSYDAFRDPAVYVKATKEGHAVLQMVPAACGGETTENGDVPPDFLPGAVWFDDANDLSLGIAYVTEDAFESPLSKLKFLGASIWPATHADYVSFEPIAAKNLMDPRPLFTIMPQPSADELRPHLGDSAMLAKLKPSIGCQSVRRLHLSDDVQRAVVRKYWPKSKPRYWMPSEAALELINKEIRLYADLMVDGRKIGDYFRLNDHIAEGFPTRAQGGVFRSKHRSWDKLPSTSFPLRRDDGVPWVSKGFPSTNVIYRDIDIGGGKYQGFAYCYAGMSAKQFNAPAYATGNYVTRIDGELIYGEDSDFRRPRDRPWPFFERDEYFYLQDDFGLN